MRTSVDLRSMHAVLEGNHGDPAQLLGPREMELQGRRMLAVRTFLPNTTQVWFHEPAHERSLPMRRIHPAGLYEAICPLEDSAESARYQFRVAEPDGTIRTVYDPYSFPSLLTDYDLHLFGEGNHAELYNRLGAQMRTVDDVAGVNFAVWAPNAASLSVVGDFNGWDGRRHPLQRRSGSGVWELFVPELRAGERYKYRIRTWWGETIEKADPFGFAAELPPCTASIVADLGQHTWNDSAWMQRRADRNPLNDPVSIYEVHLGSWRRDPNQPHQWLGYRDLAHQLVDYCHEMGFTHLELMPVSEHPFTGSWGYQTVGYYAATSRFGTPADFMYFVDYCHQHGIGVILDWVPAHFPYDGHGLARFDGTSLYEHEDPRQGSHPDWGTAIFNFGRHEVKNFLVANALFWLDKYHIDGLRVDAVASMLYLDYSRAHDEWVPNCYGGRENLEAIDFLRQFNEQCHARHPGVLTIAEESTAWGGVSRPTSEGGLGFSMKWNMGWMNDTLRYMRRDPLYRSHHHHEMTFSMVYAFSENFTLPFSHDEVVHGKGSLIAQMPGDLWQKFANLRLLFAYQWTHPGKKLNFMGNELAQWSEWNHDVSLDWDLLQFDTHRGIQRLVADLNRLYREQPAMHQLDHDGGGFEWIDCDNAGDSVFSYMRRGRNADDLVIVVGNYTPVVRHDFVIGVPRGGFYRELLNTDAACYGGSNMGNHPGIEASEQGWHNRPFSLRMTLPPLSVTVFRPE